MPDVTADELIATEIARQDRMWGAENERADIQKRQLMHAAMAQIVALDQKQGGLAQAFTDDGVAKVCFYPKDWSGFRDYGSDIANLVVAAAFIRQEIARKLRAGEDYTRTSRNPDTQPYTADQPAIIEK